MNQSIQTYIEVKHSQELPGLIQITDTSNVSYSLPKKKLDGNETMAYQEWKQQRSKHYQILYSNTGTYRRIFSMVPIGEKRWNDIVDANKSN